MNHIPTAAAQSAAEAELKSAERLEPLNLAYRMLLQRMTPEEANNNYSLAYIKLCSEQKSRGSAP